MLALLLLAAQLRSHADHFSVDVESLTPAEVRQLVEQLATLTATVDGATAAIDSVYHRAAELDHEFSIRQLVAA